MIKIVIKNRLCVLCVACCVVLKLSVMSRRGILFLMSQLDCTSVEVCA